MMECDNDCVEAIKAESGEVRVNSLEEQPTERGLGWSEGVVRLLAAQPLNPLQPLGFKVARERSVVGCPSLV